MRNRFLVMLMAASAASASAQAPAPRPTGTVITGLPALNFDADEGVGYGALLQYYDYGDTGATPYRFSVQPTLLLTTRGRKDVTIFVDAPHLLPGDWRFGAQLAREQQLTSPWYGLGNSTESLESATKGANPYFYRYGRTVLRGNADFQRSVLVPALRVLIGAGARSTDVKTVPYDSGTTLLAQQSGLRALPTTDVRTVRVGVVLDTRDREIGPHRGNWSELLVQRAGKVLGGDQVFTRLTGTIRQYVPVGEKVTVAERLVMQTVRGTPGFTEMFVLQSSYRDDEALGGGSSLRGIPKSRYAGKGVAFSNTEVRWSAAQFSLLHRDMRLVVSGFVDAGRVWADGIELSEVASDLHVGYGGGLRLAVGPTFVVATDVGHSSQSTAAVYIGLGYLF